jgi:hypothetical protein
MKSISNPHERAAREQYLAQPLDRLPSVVRQAKTRLNKIESAQRNAEEDLESAIHVNTQHRQLQAELAQVKSDLALGECELSAGQATITSIQHELNRWPRIIGPSRGAFINMLDVLSRTRTFVAYLPGWIKEQAAIVNDAERRLAEFEQQNNLNSTAN